MLDTSVCVFLNLEPQIFMPVLRFYPSFKVLPVVVVVQECLAALVASGEDVLCRRSRSFTSTSTDERCSSLVAALTTDEICHRSRRSLDENLASDAARAEVRAALARAAADRLSTPAFARPKRYAVD